MVEKCMTTKGTEWWEHLLFQYRAVHLGIHDNINGMQLSDTSSTRAAPHKDAAEFVWKITSLHQCPTFVEVLCSIVWHRKCWFWKETKGNTKKKYVGVYSFMLSTAYGVIFWLYPSLKMLSTHLFMHTFIHLLTETALQGATITIHINTHQWRSHKMHIMKHRQKSPFLQIHKFKKRIKSFKTIFIFVTVCLVTLFQQMNFRLNLSVGKWRQFTDYYINIEQEEQLLKIMAHTST